VERYHIPKEKAAENIKDIVTKKHKSKKSIFALF
jgi:hypothetical protein